MSFSDKWSSRDWKGLAENDGDIFKDLLQMGELLEVSSE